MIVIKIVLLVSIWIMALVIMERSRKILKILESAQKVTEFNAIDSDPIIRDVLKYAVERELLVSVMPDEEDKLTLFVRTEDDDMNYKICKIIKTTAPENSKMYKKYLEEMTDRVDAYIENKEEYVKNQRS